MKLSKEKPLIYPIVKFFFPAATWDRTIITWGNTSYCADVLTPALIAHESVHTKQQHHSKIFGLWWWFRYITSMSFRISQELPAHQAEYAVKCEEVRDRNERLRWLNLIAGRLAGPLYNHAMSLEKARKLIENPSPHVH